MLVVKAECSIIQVWKQREWKRMVCKKMYYNHRKSRWTYGSQARNGEVQSVIFRKIKFKIAMNWKIRCSCLSFFLCVHYYCGVWAHFQNTHLKCITFPEINTEMTSLAINVTLSQMRSSAKVDWFLLAYKLRLLPSFPQRFCLIASWKSPAPLVCSPHRLLLP
jgi:hypothetical protein